MTIIGRELNYDVSGMWEFYKAASSETQLKRKIV
jgi:hypothetical protein